MTPSYSIRSLDVTFFPFKSHVNEMHKHAPPLAEPEQPNEFRKLPPFTVTQLREPEKKKL